MSALALAPAVDETLAPLPAVREDLHVQRVGAYRDGSPRFRIHDPLRNRYFELGVQYIQINVPRLFVAPIWGQVVRSAVVLIAGFVAVLHARHAIERGVPARNEQGDERELWSWQRRLIGVAQETGQ